MDDKKTRSHTTSFKSQPKIQNVLQLKKKYSYKWYKFYDNQIMISNYKNGLKPVEKGFALNSIDYVSWCYY